MEKYEVSIHDLYKKVWEIPLTKLAESYSVNFHELKAICMDNRIPLPKAGYWTSIRHGKVILPIELSKDVDPGKILTIKSKPFEKKLNALQLKTIELQETLELLLKVPSKLTQPSKYIIAARKSLCRKPGRYSEYGLCNTNDGELNIRVAPNSVSRALRLMDSIIKLLTQRNHTIEFRYDETIAVVAGEKFQIRLKEITKRIQKPENQSWYFPRFKPTGVLTFMVGPGYNQWQILDGKAPLEKQLAKILAKLELLALKKKADRKKWKKQRKKVMKKEKRLRKLQERHDNELSSMRMLFELSSRWTRANNTRTFIEHFKEYHKNRNTLSDEIYNWISWAQEKCDWYDPLVHKNDPILNSDDRGEF